MIDEKVAQNITIWELQTQIQVLVHKLKSINKQRKRLRAQAPFIKQGLVDAERAGALKGMLFAEQYNKIIDDVCEE